MILGGNVIPELIREKIYFYMWRNKVLLCNQEYHRKFCKITYNDLLVAKILLDNGNEYRYPVNVRFLSFNADSTISKFTANSWDKHFTLIKTPENYVYSKKNIKADIFWINYGKVTKYYHKVLDKM
jgi:hypothetical protein